MWLLFLLNYLSNYISIYISLFYLNIYLAIYLSIYGIKDEEVGDGTTSVVIIAAELLKNADELVKQKIHPTSIIAGIFFVSFRFRFGEVHLINTCSRLKIRLVSEQSGQQYLRAKGPFAVAKLYLGTISTRIKHWSPGCCIRLKKRSPEM